MFKKFGEEEPPCSGYYRVVFEPGDPVTRVYLWDCNWIKDEPNYDGNGDDFPYWNWGFDEHDDPESLCLDVRDWKEILWEKA